MGQLEDAKMTAATEAMLTNLVGSTFGFDAILRAASELL